MKVTSLYFMGRNDLCTIFIFIDPPLNWMLCNSNILTNFLGTNILAVLCYNQTYNNITEGFILPIFSKNIKIIRFGKYWLIFKNFIFKKIKPCVLSCPISQSIILEHLCISVIAEQDYLYLINKNPLALIQRNS